MTRPSSWLSNLWLVLLSSNLKLNGKQQLSDLVTFLFDLISIPISSIWEFLWDILVSPALLKLHFRFEQDLIYFSPIFIMEGCDLGFDKVFALLIALFGSKERNAGNNRKQLNLVGFYFCFWETMTYKKTRAVCFLFSLVLLFSILLLELNPCLSKWKPTFCFWVRIFV